MAEESNKKSNISQQYNVAAKGLNLDNSQNNIGKGVLSYALNAAMESFDANSIQYQNEPGNTACFDFPDGYQLLGKYFIPEKSKIIFWLKNEELGKSELGYMVNNDCVYRTLINDDCLNFDINRPVLSAAHRILDNGEVEIYWADNNGRRYLNIDDIPYLPLSTSEDCDVIYSDKLNCNKLLLQPELNIPITSVVDIISGGELISGVYQFSVQYSDANGNPYTAYYNVTNPIPIADTNTATTNFNLPVGKSIIINVANLNPKGTYEYFNLAVIKTINNIPSVELIGTYFIDNVSKEIIYTGQIKTDIKLSFNDIFETFAFYENSDQVTAVQDILVWKGVKPSKRLNYQKIANNIILKWQTYRLPVSSGQYSNELISGNLRGYLRDEVYAFEIVFLLKNGKQTDAFHIPGREKDLRELTSPDILPDNPDYIGDGKTYSAFWEVYNTAEVEDFSPEFKSSVVDETITVEYCIYELRQTNNPGLTKVFNVEYTDLNNEIKTIIVDENLKIIDSLTVPVITEGTGSVQVIRCTSFINSSLTEEAKNYMGPYQYGTFSYWESTEEYPCDENIWGNLAGKKIRHHKFPDCRISPIIENSLLDENGSPIMEDVPIYPIGVLIDTNQIKRLIEESDLSRKDKDQIVGYKITRADRGVNKSIIAKGMLRNVNKYTKESQDFFYPNYPYNDLNEDPFISANNNAWEELANPYIIHIFKLNQTDTEGNDYFEVEYTNKNTNKIDTIKYYSTGDKILYSISRPVILGNGVKNEVKRENYQHPIFNTNNSIGAVENANYDVWKMDKKSGLYAGAAACFRDSVLPGETRKWTDTNSGPYYIHVLPGTVPYRCEGNHIDLDFITEVRVADSTNSEEDLNNKIIVGDPELSNRQIFNSPETSFGQPFLGSILSLETIMYGGGKAHFVEVKDNAKYRLLTKEAQEDALKTAEKVADLTQTFSLEAMFAVYNAQLTIFRNEINKRNFAKSFNSIASYNYSKPVPRNLGIKNRNLDIKRYLIPEVLNVGEEININNYQRESSVYLKATETIPFPHEILETYHNINIKDNSRFTISQIENCSNPEKENSISVVSYYGALKNRFINQYGQIYSYKSIDTGFVKIFDNKAITSDTIWGGDTFIGKFSYKTKLPFFIDNRVKFPDDSDIFYDEIGNVGYPKYWHSSRSILETWQGKLKEDLRLENFISYKAHNFDCPNSQEIEEDADPSTNPNRTYYDGYFYMFAYGVPSFYCESSYNLDLRTAFNNKEGDFWPHVSSGIPDNWVQESNVTIAQDNTYNYNVTFSKQNKESVISSLPFNWSIDNEIENYPFRSVYSDKQISNVNNKLNNWLIYRPTSYFDFPQNYGNLVALDSLQNAAILARFENKSLLYNSLVTIDTSNPKAAYIGNPNLFSNQPIDFADTDQGYIGSQHKFLLKTPYGAISCDAKRGNIFLINGNNIEELTKIGSGVHRWFTAHLPFEILKYFPEINVDNHFNGIGLHGVYDSNFERILITKLDYVPLYDNIIFKDNKFYIHEDQIEKEIFLIDSDYFCNVSWTISFNFNTKSWISFHSYIPNWYVGENNFFYSGLNYCPNDFDFLVGIKDTIIPTTTTTTSLPLTTTTSTTIPIVEPDCEFDVTIVIPDCTIEGEGVFVDDEPIPECARPDDLLNVYIFKGYTLDGIYYDTTISIDQACTALTYYLIPGLPNFEISNLEIQYSSIALNQKVFIADSTLLCNYPPDGWYFTDELAVTTGSIFRIENGIIVEIHICGQITEPTTTTTTTLPATTSYCFTGVYINPDPVHPLGGLVSYIDENLEEVTITGIWSGDTVNINAVEVLLTIGVGFCP